ncbi:MAG TPA: phospholipase domain-containing protein, partial [Puia sp.]|nr:phospholipase domain-containing protein [Puia sp.]
ENDGYFDHVPPFVAPDSRNPASGKVSEGIDTVTEHVQAENDSPGSIGLGYRVPLVIASPWSRGGWVNSQVFDHTSTLQFLEKFLNKKFRKNIEETNITKWRRTVCGDLTSVFRQNKGEKIDTLPFLAKDVFIEGIHKAKFKNVPSNFKKLTKEEIGQINNDPYFSPYFPKQEKGIRSACALPYELYAEGKLSDDKKSFAVEMKAGNAVFKEKSAGSPFNIYAGEKFSSYAVIAGDSLKDSWKLNDFADNVYQLRLYGPNGFFREFKGDANQPGIDVACNYHGAKKLTGNVELSIKNNDASALTIEIKDNAYKNPAVIKAIAPNQEQKIVLDLSKSSSWYDFSIRVKGNDIFERRYAGHVEAGNPSSSDPFMGGVV